MKELFSSENKVSRTLFETRQVAGSATKWKQRETTFFVKGQFVSLVCQGIKKISQWMKLFIFWLK